MTQPIEEARKQTALVLELVRELERKTPKHVEGFSCVTLAVGQLEHAQRWLSSPHLGPGAPLAPGSASPSGAREGSN